MQSNIWINSGNDTQLIRIILNCRFHRLHTFLNDNAALPHLRTGAVPHWKSGCAANKKPPTLPGAFA